MDGRLDVETSIEQCRDATDEEITELRQIAIGEHSKLGMAHPSEATIQIRVRSLAHDRGLRLPGSPGFRSSNRHQPKKSPNYLQAGLEQAAQACAIGRRASKLKSHIQIVRRNADRFYLFCFLKGGFAREMSKCRALEVLVAIIEHLCGDIETWVSTQTLAECQGRFNRGQICRFSFGHFGRFSSSVMVA